jgi:hypothetical protein
MVLVRLARVLRHKPLHTPDSGCCGCLEAGKLMGSSWRS